jgi:hypothetical protein
MEKLERGLNIRHRDVVPKLLFDELMVLLKMFNKNILFPNGLFALLSLKQQGKWFHYWVTIYQIKPPEHNLPRTIATTSRTLDVLYLSRVYRDPSDDIVANFPGTREEPRVWIILDEVERKRRLIQEVLNGGSLFNIIRYPNLIPLAHRVDSFLRRVYGWVRPRKNKKRFIQEYVANLLEGEWVRKEIDEKDIRYQLADRLGISDAVIKNFDPDIQARMLLSAEREVAISLYQLKTAKQPGWVLIDLSRTLILFYLAFHSDEMFQSGLNFKEYFAAYFILNKLAGRSIEDWRQGKWVDGANRQAVAELFAELTQVDIIKLKLQAARMLNDGFPGLMDEKSETPDPPLSAAQP